LQNLTNAFMKNFNENIDLRKQWGGGVMGIKNQHMMAKRAKLLEIELSKKVNMLEENIEESELMRSLRLQLRTLQ